ncbi:MAG: sulfatase-like hydrolase/transferase, partial [Rhizobiaceae bacterium]|nr:sulfatase-like hydrolase/transferase [Hyphomicrobiales bacterium]NRB32907.1 sulfatase-like hydrolase/transferase [Rhizobiaceae bacterium]
TGKPFVLMVSYVSPHPPFAVPQDIWDLYPLDKIPMPVQWRKADQPDHPALQYLNWMNMFEDGLDEDLIRRTVAGYCALITITDAQIGRVVDAMERLDLMRSTRIIYTSDHGEAAGHHGILGKANHYEHSIGVPLLMQGQGIAPGTVVDDVVSLVDLFPTLVEGVGAELSAQDQDLPGQSLWGLACKTDQLEPGAAFCEFHAMGSVNASFALRKLDYKLIYHVDMPNQLFDLANDPNEENDLLAGGKTHPKEAELVALLKEIVDPEQTDQRAKSDQRARIEELGGVEAVANAGVFSVSPIPGKQVDLETTR